MQLTADFHTHTSYSDGHCKIEEQVARAKELGLKAFALTEHGFSHLIFGLKRKEYSVYREKTEAAEKKYGIRVLLGIEENILGREGSLGISREELDLFDVLLIGYHVMSTHETWRDWWNSWRGYLGYNLGLRGKGKLADAQTRGYIETVKKNPVDIVTHIGFQCFAHALDVAKCCGDYGTYVELSGKKTHFTDDELDAIVHHTSARFVVNSDAHTPDRMGDIALAAAQIERVGVPLGRIDNIDGRMPTFRLAEYKKSHLS